MDRTISKIVLHMHNICGRKANNFANKSNTNVWYMTARNESSTGKQKAHTLVQTPLNEIHAPKLRRQKKFDGQGRWALLAIPIATFGLGTWQIQRRKWKLKLIDDLKAKTTAPPISLPEDLSELSSLEYRRITVRGKFDHSKEVYLGPRSILKDGAPLEEGGGLISTGVQAKNGYLVITPFILSDSGQRILVNRGWVQTKMVSPNKRLEGQIEDEQEFDGLVRLKERRGVFMGENIKRIRIFHYRDLDAMADMCDALPVYLDAPEESSVPGGPLGGQTNINLRNEHMTYIITWYSLSAFTLILWCTNFL